MKNIFTSSKTFWLAAAIFSAGRSPVAANPTGLTVTTGSATAQAIGSQLNISASQFAVLNWHSFNIQNGETTTFQQPNSSSIVFNVIGSANPSQIFGNLNANGTVILANANGFYFGPNSMIKVGGSFVATTAAPPLNLDANGPWQFTGTPPLASIVNYGSIQVGAGRSLFLIAENIENHGSLTAPSGKVELTGGDTVLVSESPDGRGLSASVQLPQGSVDNFGRITADAGTIALQAKVVNQNGVLQADSISDNHGQIELVASDQLNLGANSQILAQGDASTTGSAGGTVTLKSGNTFSDTTGSQIITTGGANGGHGGNIEVSAPNIESLNSAMNAGANAESKGGEFLLDPANIVLGTTGAGTVPANGTVDSGSGSGTLNLNVNTAFLNKNFANIVLQATGNITLNTGTTWNLSTSTGESTGQLLLQAGGDIIFGNNSKITDANNWLVELDAGYNFANNTITAGTGNIYLNGGIGGTGSGTITTAAGNINLQAGSSILVGSGSVFTTGGGNIFAYAQAGDINAGTFNGGSTASKPTTDYNFTGAGATPNPFLGGISTAAGGDVTLIAGNNIISTPTVPTRQAPGASGTYGSGDVNLIAGNQITGNYTLADGTGTVLAGIQVQGAQAAALQQHTADAATYTSTLSDLKNEVMQSQNPGGNIGAAPVNGNPSTAPVTFGLIKGSWNAFASDDISVREVNNPNGAFNTLQGFSYNYAPDAAANFWAGNAIELTGANLGRVTSQNTTTIYAPSLSLNAGAGGIQIDKSIILAPSSEGSLSIITRNGGNLSGAVTSGSTVLNGITMSDSDSSSYSTFAAGHAGVPLHLNDPNPNPVYLDIDGSINSFSLTVPTFASINVHGNTYNFGFQGQNLSPSQTTSIKVDGSISYRGNLTSIELTAAGLADPLPASLFTASADPAVTENLRFDPASGTLLFVGVMSSADLAFLLAPSIFKLNGHGDPVTQIVLDENGKPVLDENGNPEFAPVTIPLTLDDSQKALITQLYTASQSASLGDQGLALSGPGHFNVSANSMDLGVSGGIRVVAPDSALAAISPYGADLNVSTIGDLTMTATKISNESLDGNINLTVGGTLDVGNEFSTLGDVNAPKGIYTTSSGNISVTAYGDVDVNGSRIAAYNGGNITLESLNGNINAGDGGNGFVSLDALQLDPVTGQLIGIPATIPGSGILATTVVGSDATLGNILAEAPNGNISASKGGVLQISFNGTDASQAACLLLAGYELRDASGVNRLTAADINGLDQSTPSDSPTAPFNLVDNFGNTVGTFQFGSAGRNVDASGSGIIAQNINVLATGSVGGLFVGRGTQPVQIQAPSTESGVPLVVIGQTTPIVNIGDTQNGDPVIISDSGSSGVGAPAAAAPVEAITADTASTVTTKTEDPGDEFGQDDSKKKGEGISLSQKVGRVTVLLPQKN